MADVEVTAPYDDLDALQAFARRVSVVTFEFENVPSAATSAIESIVAVRPSPEALHISQQRAREKQFLADRGFPTVPFAVATTQGELASALARIGTPAIVKTAESGYDGKGQQVAASADEAGRIWSSLGAQVLVVEKRINLQAELSVIAARGLNGDVAQFPLFENRHRQPHPRSDHGARRGAGRGRGAGDRDRAAASSTRSTTWACSASSSS